MKQGSTYPIIITVPGIDLSGAEWIIVSIQPRAKPAMEFTMDDMMVVYADGITTLTLQLTQAQSLALDTGIVPVDLNWLLDGMRGGCIPSALDVTYTLLDREVNL